MPASYLLLFFLTTAEGPISTVLAGTAVSLGLMHWLPAYLAAVAGDLAGDLLHYAAGHWGGLPFIERWGKYVGLQAKHVVALEKLFNGREGRALLLGKLAHGVGGAFLVAAGIVKMPLGKFFTWNTLGTLPKTLGLLLLGYYFAHAITQIHSLLDLAATLTIIIGLGGGFAWLYFYGRKKEPPQV